MADANSNSALLSGAYALTALSAVIILFRIILRRLKHEDFTKDDGLMVLGVGLYAVYTAGFALAIIHDINLDKQWDPRSWKQAQVDSVSLGSKWLLASRTFYMSYLWVLKACMLIYYTRLELNDVESLGVKATGGILFGTWFGCMLTFFLECRPVHLYWQVIPNAPICAKAIGATIMICVCDLLTNFLLMALPILLILRSNLPLRENIQIGLLYLLALFTIVASILRLVLVLSNITQQHTIFWGQIELLTSTLLTNLPIISQVWLHGLSHARRGRFGRDECPPEYTLAVRTATESEAEADDYSQSQSRVQSLGGGIRKSIKAISSSLRRSLEVIQIQTSVELLQETKQASTKEAQVEHRGAGEEMFSGGPRAAAGPVAQISSYATGGHQLEGEGRRESGRSGRGGGG